MGPCTSCPCPRARLPGPTVPGGRCHRAHHEDTQDAVASATHRGADEANEVPCQELGPKTEDRVAHRSRVPRAAMRTCTTTSRDLLYILRSTSFVLQLKYKVQVP